MTFQQGVDYITFNSVYEISSAMIIIFTQANRNGNVQTAIP